MGLIVEELLQAEEEKCILQPEGESGVEEAMLRETMTFCWGTQPGQDDPAGREPGE